jgi:two-component system NtrC family sensor kinase
VRGRSREVENARLFETEQQRTKELMESLEQQTATSEILRVISNSVTDVQPVFAAIAASATRLCDAVNCLVIRFDGRLMHLMAHHNVIPERLVAVGSTYSRYRTALAVPMLHDDDPIGAIVVARDRVAPFSEKHITLLQTFADDLRRGRRPPPVPHHDSC